MRNSGKVEMTSLVQTLSGRKKESSIWDCFTYNVATNKSRCTVPNEKDEECGFQMSGKKTSNLKLHVKAKHPAVFRLIDDKDGKQKLTKNPIKQSYKRKAVDMAEEGMVSNSL